MRVYVLKENNEPLMPCKPVIARLLLKDGKAKVVQREPFVIKLLHNAIDYKQPIAAGMDTGSKVIGAAAIGNNKVLYQSEVQLRNDITRKMKQRANFRRTRRSRLRYRPCRFNNRSNSVREDRYAPTIISKYNSHQRERKFIESILPVTKWITETMEFDIHKIINPDVNGIEYQNGTLKGYYNTKQYVLHRDNYLCQKCKKKSNKILHVHHIIPRSKGGSNNHINLITLCKFCHEDVHNGKFNIKAKRNKTKFATQSNVIASMLHKSDWEFEETYGYETKFKREHYLKLPKTHYNDAVAICCNNGLIPEFSNTVYYKKHVAKGDYKQTKGSHSQIKIPTGKLYGFRKFDKVKSPKGTGFVKGKMSTGYLVLCDIDWNTLGVVNVKSCKRISARSTTLIERKYVER